MRRAMSLFLALFLALVCIPGIAEEYAEGSRGDEVERFQQRLADLGYLTGSVDGIYGRQTTTAVSLFQELNGLTSTGIVDEATLEAIYSTQARQLREGLERDDEGEAVQLLQERLILLGFLDDDADGKYGKNTENAVAAFQEHLIAQGVSRVASTGEATPVTQEYLFDEARSTYLKDLSLGAEDSEVRRVERRLHALGYLDDTPDSAFDDYTEDVVRAFQSAAGLNVTGTVDKQTIDALFSTSAPASERFVAHDIYAGDTGAAVEAVQAALAQYGMLAAEPDGKYGSDTEEALERFYNYLSENGSPYAEHFAMYDGVTAAAQDLLADEDFFVYREDVTSGASEAEILRVQRRLYTLYYISESIIDGEVGSKTEAAIREFQANNRLEETGVADEETQRALFSANAMGKNTKYKLKVSIDDQRVYVYGLNTFGEYELDRTFICSTGLGNSTPPGIYTTTTEPLNRWQYFQKFECWAQYSFRITGDIWFHSVLYDAPDTSTLRYGSVYALGSKASHGCVRLQVEDAKWIYENCDEGTIVVVY